MCLVQGYPGPAGGLGADAALGEGCSDDVWFCPRHTCLGCGALEATACSISAVDLPLAFYETTNSGEHRPLAAIEQKTLRCCSGCSFSVCMECDSGTAAQVRVPSLLLPSKRGSEVRSFRATAT